MESVEISIKGCKPELVQFALENLPKEEKRKFLKTLNKITERSKKTGIYLELKNFSKEEIDYALIRRSREEYEFLQRCYGKELLDSCKEELTEEEQEKLRVLLTRLKNLLYYYREKGRPKKEIAIKDLNGIYLKFKNYSKEEIDYILSTRRKEEIDLLKKGYGEDFNGTLQKERLTDKELEELEKLLAKIRGALRNYRKRGKRKVKTVRNQLTGLYSYFKSSNKEEVDYALSRRNKSEIELLKKAYGLDFTESNKDKLTDKELEELKKILKKISHSIYGYKKRGRPKTELSNNQLGGIYFRFKTYSKEAIDYVLSKTKEKDLKLFRKCYGEDLNGLFRKDELTEEEKKELIMANRRFKASLRRHKNKDESKPKKIIEQKKSLTNLLKSKGYLEINILLSIKKLSATEQELLVKCYGENFDDCKNVTFDYIEEQILSKAIRKIEIDLEGLEKELPQSIYEYEMLSKIRKYYIDLAINTLEIYEQEILKTIFGKYLLIYRDIPKLQKEVENIIQKIYYLIIAMQIAKPEDNSVKFLGCTPYCDLINAINKLPNNYKFYLKGMINLNLGKDLKDQEIENLRRIYAEIMQNLIRQKKKTK